MLKNLWFIPPPRHLVILMLATMWLNFQFTDGKDTYTYKRFKRWSTTLLAKPVEQHECKTDSDCSGNPNTSCAQDPADKRQKCLCADSSPPVAGDCRKLPKALRTPCSADIECLPGAECIEESGDARVKVCQCREEYAEVNNTCTNAICGTGSTTTKKICFELPPPPQTLDEMEPLDPVKANKTFESTETTNTTSPSEPLKPMELLDPFKANRTLVTNGTTKPTEPPEPLKPLEILDPFKANRTFETTGTTKTSKTP